MGEKPAADIDFVSSLSHYGSHYFLTAKSGKKLSGRGIIDLEDGRYRVTPRAYGRICKAHNVAYKAYLD